MKLTVVVACSLLGLAPLPARAAEERSAQAHRLVTDPAELQSYGLSDDAIFFIAPGADVAQPPGGMAGDELSAAARQTVARRSTAQKIDRIIRYKTYDSQNLVANDIVTSAPLSSGLQLRYWPQNRSDPRHSLQVQLEKGARLQGLRWWAVDQKFEGDPDLIVFRFFSTCLPAFEGGHPVVTLLATATTDPEVHAPQSGFMDLPDMVVDNASCAYVFELDQSLTVSPLDSIYLQRVRVQYSTLNP